MDWQALWLTAKLAGVTTVIVVPFIAIPLAAWLALSRRRWTPLVEAVVALPLFLPPTVLGLYLAVGLSPNSPLGKLWNGITGSQLSYTFWGLVFASVLFSLPAAVQPLLAAFGGLDRRLLDASAILGRGRIATLWWVMLPMSGDGLLAAVVLSLASTVGEFGVVLMVGGNIPGETRTASISIYESEQDLNYSLTGPTVVALLVFFGIVFALTYWLQRRGLPTWLRR